MFGSGNESASMTVIVKGINVNPEIHRNPRSVI